jgi:hypothetical protein
MTIYKLDYHRAYKTNAYTWWYIVDANENVIPILDAEKEGLIKVVHDTFRAGKTHWFRYVEVLEPEGIKGFIRERESNRGNITRQIFTLQEMEQFKANPEEIPIKKVKGNELD